MTKDEQVLNYLLENGQSLAAEIEVPGINLKGVSSSLGRLVGQGLVERTHMHGGRKRVSMYTAIGSIPKEEDHIYILRNLPRDNVIHA
jgi:hypothetical protein